MRAQIIFAGDNETYKAAKDASDGLEHGFWELDQIARNAPKSADKMFLCVRQTIVSLLGVSPEIAAELNDTLLGDLAVTDGVWRCLPRPRRLSRSQ